ncbi:Transmembrane channel-like protein 7 [Durusdinium trenchii]|uniref:Transmembrane channel-like protein 7 n=1 Tax=Durusdinium trenchii TaxID=1381693 RepID=A0ABP0MM26_9DINO
MGGKSKGKGEKGGKGKKGEEDEDERLQLALGELVDEPDPKCPWCQGEYSQDSNFCGSCGKPRKALTCYNCESQYLKGAKFCRSCGMPRPFVPELPRDPRPPSTGAPSAGVEAPSHAPHDWVFEDELVQELVPEEPEVNLDSMEDDSWPMRDMCRSVQLALDGPYLPLVKILRAKLAHMRGLVAFAANEKQRWRTERRELKERSKELKVQVEAEKDKALQRVTRQANHSLAVTLSTGGPRANRGRASMRIGAEGLELMEATEQEHNPIDMAANMILKSRVGSLMVTIAHSIIPLQSDVQRITSEFGSGCGTFFRFYSYLLLLALFAAVSFLPLFFSPLSDTSNGSVRICGYLPCSLFLGSFYLSAGEPEEQWLSAVDLRLHSNGSLVTETDLGPEAFNSMFTACPMVRLVRDCRVAAVFAGFLENSSWPTSAYEVFTASWKDMPGTQNQDWVLYSRFADVIQAEEPWPACGDSSQAQGFPGVCLPEGSQLTGRWFGFADSFNGSLPSYGLQLQVFNASRCFASSASEIRNMVGGIKASSGTSAKDLNIALWFVFGNVVSIVFAVFFFLVWWQTTEAKYNFEQFSENLEPMRWSSLVFGLWNFRVSSESDRLLWRQSVADQLRLLQAEEKDQESVKSRTTIDQNMLLFKRCSGFCVNIAIIVGLWFLIWFCSQDRQLLVESLGNSFESIGARGLGEWLGASLAPLVVTGAGVVLPPAVELLTQLEAWPRSWQALLNITRFFLGQILTAGLYMAISMELLFDWPLWTGGDLVLQPLVEPCGQYRCKADQAGAEILALVVTEFVMMMIKPFVKLGLAATLHWGKARLGMKGAFMWPEFQIQDDAVNVVYFSALLWMSLSTVPYMALIGPLLMYIHFKWLKFSLQYLTRRPFVTETTSLLVTLQRITCFNFVMLGFLIMAQIIIIIPYEPTCGPVNGFQAAGQMIWQLDLPLKDLWSVFYDWTLQNRGSIVVVMLMAMLVLRMLHQVSLRTNRTVVEQMSGVANRQVASLSRELWRLERRNDLLKRRLEWLEGKATDENE